MRLSLPAMGDLVFRTNSSRTPRLGTCLFLHGAGGSSLTWLSQLRSLPSGWAGLAPDLPAPEAVTGVGDYAALVEAALPATGPRLVVIGHSLGGAIAMAIALRRKLRLHGLVLAGTAARFRIDPCVRDRFLAGEHGLAFGPAASPALVRASLREWRKRDAASIGAAFALAAGHDVRGLLGEVRLPALVVGGSADRLTPPHLVRELAESIPGSRLIMLDGTGHMLMLEQPSRLAALIREFLEAIIAATAGGESAARPRSSPTTPGTAC
ncbi:MAG TPA: alpha/beta hydrolase [Bacillota bacterium]|nr:alpha/beta hydrolase [Bacillota bacterium]